MNGLPINRVLNEENRLSTVILHHPKGVFDGIYDLYRGNDGAMYITEHGRPENILLIATKEIWSLIFER